MSLATPPMVSGRMSCVIADFANDGLLPFGSVVNEAARESVRSTATAFPQRGFDRIELYARVSTRDKGQNPELQLSELREYAKARGWQVIGEFVDVGVSGSKDSRPHLDAMMRLAKARKLDVIAVWKLDRFGRSLRHLVDALAELDAVGVAFVSLRDNIDLSTPSGRLMFQIIGAMAEFERALIQERVRAGLTLARSKCTKLGRRGSAALTLHTVT